MTLTLGMDPRRKSSVVGAARVLELIFGSIAPTLAVWAQLGILGVVMLARLGGQAHSAGCVSGRPRRE